MNGAEIGNDRMIAEMTDDGGYEDSSFLTARILQ